jgi:hypothetical protein
MQKSAGLLFASEAVLCGGMHGRCGVTREVGQGDTSGGGPSQAEALTRIL